jgi:hypothetical protein
VFRRVAPEIVAFLVIGVLVGPHGPLHLVYAHNVDQLQRITHVAVGSVMFLFGQRLRAADLRRDVHVLRAVTVLPLLVTAGATYLVTRWAGASTSLATLLAIIATETGVLTVTATVREEGAESGASRRLLATVGLSNVVTAAAFGIGFPLVLATSGRLTSPTAALGVFGRATLAAIGLGIAAAVLLLWIERHVHNDGELLLTELLVITGTVGLSVTIHGSLVISLLATGIWTANRGPAAADRLFGVLRVLEAPFYLLFFIVAGAEFRIQNVPDVGLIGAAYILARGTSKVTMTALGGRVLGSLRGRESLRLGGALLPHAGMAVALVAYVGEQAPTLGERVSTIVLTSVFLFEVVGPLFVRRFLRADTREPA